MRIRHTGNWGKIAVLALIALFIVIIGFLPSWFVLDFSSFSIGSVFRAITAANIPLLLLLSVAIQTIFVLRNDERTIQSAAGGDDVITPLARHPPDLAKAITGGMSLTLRRSVGIGAYAGTLLIAIALFFLMSFLGFVYAMLLLPLDAATWMLDILTGSRPAPPPFTLSEWIGIITPVVLALSAAITVIWVFLGRQFTEITADDAGLSIKRLWGPRRTIPWSALRVWLRRSTGNRQMAFWVGTEDFAMRMSLYRWAMPSADDPTQAERMVATITARSQVPLREYGYRVVGLRRKAIVQRNLADLRVEDLPAATTSPHLPVADLTNLPFVLRERIPIGRFLAIAIGLTVFIFALGLLDPQWQETLQLVGLFPYFAVFFVAFLIGWAYNYAFVLVFNGTGRRKLTITQDMVRIGTIALRWNDIQAWAMISDAKQRNYTIYTDRSTYSWQERLTAEAPDGRTTAERRAAYLAQAETAHALIAQLSGKPLRSVT